VRDSITKLSRVWKHAGTGYALLWVLDRLLYRIRVQIIVVRIHNRDSVLQNTPAQIPPYEIRWATREEVLAAADDGGKWLDHAPAAAQLDRGERCMGAFLNGRMVACSWSAASGPICPELDINVPPQLVYGHEAKTQRAHRGNGLYGTIVQHAARAAAEAGMDMVGYVYMGNSQAVAGSMRMGRMGTGFILCRGGRRPWWWLSPYCRRRGIWVTRTTMRLPYEEAGVVASPAQDRPA
jgi:hypothetical protein